MLVLVLFLDDLKSITLLETTWKNFIYNNAIVLNLKS